MNEITLESFITYCDDMMIAEEGLKDGFMKLLRKTTKKENSDYGMLDGITRCAVRIRDELVKALKNVDVTIGMEKQFTAKLNNNRQHCFTYSFCFDNKLTCPHDRRTVIECIQKLKSAKETLQLYPGSEMSGKWYPEDMTYVWTIFINETI